MSENKKIVYGDRLTFDDRPLDIRIDSINIDNFNEIIHLTLFEKGETKSYSLTMQLARDIGFINIDALNIIL